jgi:AcrR family transcriptional regulator
MADCQAVTATESRDMRTVLIEAAARLLAEHGPDALTTRRLAAEVGSSTMAVYTHFGSMQELYRAIREEGFARLGSQWGAVEPTRDPVADLSVSGATYVFFALRNPHLYRAMFFETPLDSADNAAANIAGPQLTIIRRCIDADRFDKGEPGSVLWQLWASTHGIVAGILGGVLELAAAEELLFTLGLNLYVGFGDDRAAARRSLKRARTRMQHTNTRPDPQGDRPLVRR